MSNYYYNQYGRNANSIQHPAANTQNRKLIYNIFLAPPLS